MFHTLVLLRARYQQKHAKSRMLQCILKNVSRSFYLSLRVLGRSVRTPISLAYLFCRAADTIVDTPLFPRAQQWNVLQTFRQQFLHEHHDALALQQLRAEVLSSPAHQAEQHLSARLPECFALLRHLDEHDRQFVRQLVLSLTHGMEMDFVYFAKQDATTPHAFPDLATLDLYTYYVAGVVGNFWTQIHAQHWHGWQPRTVEHLCDLGVRFGKGLQMTNILKDVGKDLALGRCYIPQEQLAQAGLTVAELTQPGSLGRFRPLLTQLIWHTLDHLDHACHYVLQLPYHTIRVRLSCLWPLLFAVQTLEVVYSAGELLCPTSRVSISRRAVYRTMCISCACLIAPGIVARYYARLRRRLTHALTSPF